jgi:hypothetical protein
MISTWEQAAQCWLAISRVASGFAWFIIQPAPIHLLLPGLCWLYEATQTFNDYSWRRESGLEDNLVEMLRTCWERHSAEVANDPVYREPFQGLLTRLASHGGHAAAALRERILDSIPNTR